MMTMAKIIKNNAVLECIEKYPPYVSVKHFRIDIRALADM